MLVKVIEIDKQGRINLSRKDALLREEKENKQKENAKTINRRFMFFL